MNRNISHGMRYLMLLLTFAQLIGCRSAPEEFVFDNAKPYQTYGIQIEYPDAAVEPAVAIAAEAEPFTLRSNEPTEYWDMTLEEAIATALRESKIMRDLGVRVLDTPTAAMSVYDPALTQTDPRFGEERALSVYDAQFATSVLFNRDERSFNNVFFGGGATSVASNSANHTTEISKLTPTGTQFAVRGIVDYTRNYLNSNLFPSAYDVIYQAEARHPLLRGSGIEFNRIAGPDRIAGNFNGIMLARINTDVALADFEVSVRNFINQVEQQYWILYYTYRNLDARQAARTAAQGSWERVKNELEAGKSSGLDESLARQQFYDFEQQVEAALSGTNSATQGSLPGVYSAERQLRLLIGLPSSDGRLIRPADEPSAAETLFDWQDSLFEAANRRVELRRQNWTVRRRELELLASKNLTQVQLDLVGQYTWRGFGDDLFGTAGNNASAYRDLFGGDLQGWGMGLELSTPIGNRLAHSAVRNAELALAKEKAILEEQHRAVSNDLSNAFGELDRAYIATRTAYNQVISAQKRLELTVNVYEAGNRTIEFVLDAQSALADAEARYHQSMVDYSLAISRIHYARGTYLDYMGIDLSEGPWCAAAHRSAAKEAKRFVGRSHVDEVYTLPCPITRGRFEQHPLPRNPVIMGDVIESVEVLEPQLAPEPVSIEPAEPIEPPAALTPPEGFDLTSPEA